MTGVDRLWRIEQGASAGFQFRALDFLGRGEGKRIDKGDKPRRFVIGHFLKAPCRDGMGGVFGRAV